MVKVAEYITSFERIRIARMKKGDYHVWHRENHHMGYNKQQATKLYNKIKERMGG